MTSRTRTTPTTTLTKTNWARAVVAGGAGTGTGSTTNTNAQTQIVYLVSTVATVAAIRQQVNELAAEYGIEATNWTDRLFAVIARTHALVVRRCR
ncbi:MAG TPA: hypothetical protein VHJ58_12170 [Vicinamibacterales bacterium]|nr:hypothetical protein [Vicinamibacterales bacterium]